MSTPENLLARAHVVRLTRDSENEQLRHAAGALASATEYLRDSSIHHEEQLARLKAAV
jgi:hypothetical protein